MTILKLVLVCTTIVSLSAPSFVLAGDADDDEQAAIVAAVNRVAPAVVRIETVGGQERIGHMLFGVGPTTGFVVDPSGYIISSAFNFINQPASILVRLPNGVRKPAERIATDHSRMLVLLKVDVDKNSPLLSRDQQKVSPLLSGEEQRMRALYEIAPPAERRVGQWTIAVGRAFESQRPNIAVGILSALDRVWGKAMQTDAAVSPNNYGGPLIDIRGRVLGILAPLSPETADEIAGVDWYDSGVGFAVPMEQILDVLPRLKNGEDLYPGRAGIGLKGPNLYTGEPVVAVCHPKSPAAAAGLMPGDRIIEIDGRNTARAADVKREIGRRYAGQTMHMVVLRGKQRMEKEITLAKKLEPVTKEEEKGRGERAE